MTRRVVETLIVTLLLDVVGIGVPVPSVESCPSFCECDTWYELQRASCTSRHLYSIHTGAPSSVQALDVSNNSISALNDYELADAGLSKLKYLNLSTNAISQIALNAFDGLSELRVLDLSQNHFYYLLSEIFIPAKNLRILRLSRNNFNSHIPKLQCPSLTDLSLDSCQISHIPADMFIGLSRVRNLDLSNNLMIQLDSVALRAMQFLRELSLEGNPWSCNKLMYDLQLYLKRENIQYHAMCNAKSKEPKKFEKMMAYPKVKYEKRLPPITSNVNVKKNTTTKKQTPVENDTIACINATEESSLTRVVNVISPYWFFLIGFVVGSACSMFMCYIWLTKKLTYHGRRSNDIQRLSLLQNPWHVEDCVFNEITPQTSRPGTPPPPYREVMSRPGLYRNLSTTNHLNNNTAARNTEHI